MKISKSGSLYSFYQRLSNTWLFDTCFDYEDDGTLSMFKDDCTFIRGNIKLIMWSIFFFIMFMSLLVAFVLFLYVVATYVLTGGDGNISWGGLITSSIIIFGSYVYAYVSTKNDDSDTFIDSFIRLIKDRSDKYCSKIELDE